jgi:DNA processing protein
MDPFTLTAVALSIGPGRLPFVAGARLLEARRQRPSLGSDLTGLLSLIHPERCDAASLAGGLETRARRLLDRAAAAGIRPLGICADAYPPALARLPDAPCVLWIRGDAAVLAAPCVAIVGSRAASLPALHAARQMGDDLAAAGVVVVSGLARGIDAAAHEGALSCGRTIAVLGSGVDVVYPAEHAGLASRIAAAGAVVAELPPGTSPQKHHFPLRNRIISGLSLAVVVAEAAERSGALITARLALDHGREVMAMPGAVAGGRNRGAHGLIRDGALLVESAADVLDALRLLPRADPVNREPATALPDEPVLRLLTPGVPMELDVLAARAGLPVPTLLARVASLELEGWLERVPVGRIVRVARKW